MAHENRWYRQLMQSSRFVSFNVTHKETDLWIGVDKDSYRVSMKDFIFQSIINYRNQLDEYINMNPDFKTSFAPILPDPTAPPIAVSMIEASRKASVGPMAAVAGAFADYIAIDVKHQFSIKEIIIENGGDISLTSVGPIQIAVFAGNSSLSNKVGIEIPNAKNSIGVCTSSATVGPSISFGKTDATMIVCESAALADAYASYFGNLVKSPKDISSIIEKAKANVAILSALIICGEEMGICGKFELKLFK